MLGKCYMCHIIKFGLKEYDFHCFPGSGRIVNICKKCWPNRPKGFEEQYGISLSSAENAKRVKPIGNPMVTDFRHGENAYGSVLELMSDGSKIPIICGHGGSAWLCFYCAKKIMDGTSQTAGVDLAGSYA
jgi:hypothetical protein